MSIHVANPDRLGAAAIAAVLEPPPPVDFLTWATDNVIFSDRESNFSGPYNRDLFPEWDEPLRALSPDDPCRVVTLVASAQIGKTVVVLIFALGSLDMDPGDVLVVHPTEENGVRWSKMKLMPMLKAITRLARLFVSKSRDGGDSIMFKERIDGRGAIQISGANSPASLSQITMRRQAQDDLAKWQMNAAGDPETQADSRSRAHEFAKILKASTPLVSPGCRITNSFEAGTRERPFVPCPHCGGMQVLEWENLQASIDADPDRPHFVCTSGNGCVIEEHQLAGMKRGLEWRADNPKAASHHRSFWIWSAYSTLQSWPRIAREWLSAKGDPGKEKAFFNDTLGLAYRAAGESVPWETLRDRAAESPYAKGLIPSGYCLLTCGVDCQGDRVEFQVVAWGPDYRRAVIDYGVFPGHISDLKTQLLLDGLLKQTWPNAAGRRLELDMTGIDGNAWTEDVWGWARRHPASKLMMLRGRGEDTAPLLARVKRERSKQGVVLRYQRRFYNFATSVLKMALYRNLEKTDSLERGHIAFPRGLEDEYFRQLTAERRQPVKRKDGFVAYIWAKDPGQANEGLDTHLQAEAAAIRLGVRSLPDARWAQLQAERETPLAAVQGDLEELMLATAPEIRRPGTPVPDPAASRTPFAPTAAKKTRVDRLAGGGD